VSACKEKRMAAMMPTKEFWSKKQFTDSSSMEQWIQARRNIEAKYAYNSETESATATMRHLKEVSKSNLNVARKNPVMTTDYGFIDQPPTTHPHPVAATQNAANDANSNAVADGAAATESSKDRIDEDIISSKNYSKILFYNETSFFLNF
jgi:hypothetical protein